MKSFSYNIIVRNLSTKKNPVKKQLKDIAEIQSGFYIRTDGNWDISYLQAKNFDEFGDLKEKLVSEIKTENIQERQLLQKWDILFSSKWTRNFATVYKEEYWKCIASSTFFVIRIKDKNILPEYITLILNEAQKGAYFKNNLSWWYIQSIPKPILEEFKIKIPPIEKQKRTIELYTLYKQQLQIYEKLKKKKEILINKIILSSHSSNND